MTGLILADPEVVRLMDGGGGDSDLVPVHIKGQEIGARSAVLTSEQFELLQALHALSTGIGRQRDHGRRS